MKSVTITAVRRSVYADLIEQYENPIEHACDISIGQVYVSQGGQKPSGFCDSAWTSVAPFVKELAVGGGNFYDGWMKDPHTAMISCNDGFRPVSFLLQTVDDE